MAYMSAREMLSGLPVKMAEGGPVTYGKGATAADLLAAEQRVLLEMEDPSTWDPATAYAAIMESGVSVQDALDAGVAQSTIDAIFTTPAGEPAYGGPAPTATMSSDVQNYYNTIMADDQIDAAERLEMQKIATDQGLSYDDILAAGVDPNILYNTPAAAPTTKVCPIGTLKAGQTIGINDDCGVLPAKPPGLTDAEKAAQLAASQAAFTNTQEEYVAPTVYQPLPDNTSVYAAGEESLDREFRDSAPRTEVLDSYGNLTNFDYTPAASLRSATGSGYNWTPPTVTGRPRSLMGADLLARYTGGRSAADLRQLTTGLGNGRTYSDYTGVLQNPGSYSGGLSKSQLYSRMRGLDYQRDAAAAAADRGASTARGGISAYLAANPDIAASYEAQRGQLGGQSLEQFARNHYNTTGRAEMDAGKRGLFTLVADKPVYTQGAGMSSGSGRSGYEGGYEGEGEDYGASNWNQRYDMGKAGGVTRPFAHGGSVKKPQGFADGGTASADLLQRLKEAEQNVEPAFQDRGFSVSPPDNNAPAFQDRGISVFPPDNGEPAFQDRGFSVFPSNDAALAQEPTESPNIPNNILTKAATPPERSPSILEKTVAGIPSVARDVYNYGKDVVTAPSPSAKLLADAMGVGMKATLDPVQYGAELLGFDDARQLAVMREAVAMTNELVDNGYLDESSRVKLVGSTDDSSATRENVHIEGNEEVFNAVNHALFSYYAGQNPIAGLGAQIKEVKQGLQQIDRGNNPRTEYLDYFNNQFGLNLAKQGLTPEDAKYQIMVNIGNIAGKGTRGRLQRGEEIKAGTDLLTNVQDATGVARYPWEKYAESVMDDADKLRAE